MSLSDLNRMGNPLRIGSYSEQRRWQTSGQLIFKFFCSVFINKKSKLTDSKDLNQTSRLDYILSTNRFILYSSNFISSLNIPFRKFSSNRWYESKTLSYSFAYIRFWWFLLISLRHLLALLFNSCQYNFLRYYIYDWSIFYPMNIRSDLSRCVIALCTIQLTLKRMVFLKKPLDDSLLNHLCNFPREESLSFVGQSREEAVEVSEKLADCSTFEIDYQSYSRYLDRLGSDLNRLDEIDVDGLTARLELYNTSTLTDSVFKFGDLKAVTSTRYREYSNYNRDYIHWIYVSKHLKRACARLLILLTPLVTAICIGACLRIGYLLEVTRDCDLKPPLLRLIGVIEVFVCLFDFGATIFGVANNIIIMNLDLTHQSRHVEEELQVIVQELRCGCEQDKSLRLENIKSSTTSHRMTKREDFGDKVHMNLKNSDKYTFSVSSNPCPIQGLHNGLRQIDKTRLEEIQHKVIGFLTSMDSQKPLVALIGGAQYVWLASTFPFIPLIVRSFVRGTITTNLLPNFIYIALMCIPIIFTMLLTTTGASINQSVSLRASPQQLKV